MLHAYTSFDKNNYPDEKSPYIFIKNIIKKANSDLKNLKYFNKIIEKEKALKLFKKDIEDSIENNLLDMKEGCDTVQDTAEYLLKEFENEIEKDFSQDETDYGGFENVDEDYTGGNALYGVALEFYDKSYFLPDIIEKIVLKVNQLIRFNTDGYSLKGKEIILEFKDKLPKIIHSYLLYGICYITPEKTSENHDFLINTDYINGEESYEFTKEEKFKLRVLTPLEVFPILPYADYIRNEENKKDMRKLDKWGWQQYDPFRMFYIYQSKNLVYTSLLIPVNSKSESSNITTKQKLNGGDPSLFNKYMSLLVACQIDLSTITSTLPYMNILTIKDPSILLSGLLQGDDSLDTAKEKLLETFENQKNSKSGLPVLSAPTGAETRFDSPLIGQSLEAFLKMSNEL
jgi:hypothetical protein